MFKRSGPGVRNNNPEQLKFVYNIGSKFHGPGLRSVDDVDSVARVRKKSPVLIPALGFREMVDRRRTKEPLTAAAAAAAADPVEVVVEPLRPPEF